MNNNSIFLLGSKPEVLSQCAEKLTVETNVVIAGLCDGYFSDQQKLINDIVKDKGSIDILVNNAGTALHCEMSEITDKQFRKIMDLNVDAVFRLSRAVIKSMRKKEKSLKNMLVLIITRKNPSAQYIGSYSRKIDFFDTDSLLPPPSKIKQAGSLF